MIAAPIGPVAFIIFRFILQNRFSLALLSGLGAAFADALLGCAALLGLQWVNTFFEKYQTECRLGGGIFLIFLGSLLFKYPPKPKAFQFSDHPLVALGSGLLITIFNPLTFTAFLAIFSIFNIQSLDSSIDTRGFLTFALFAGALTWWAGLSLLALWGKKWLSLSEITRLNKWVSLFLIVCGVGTILHTLFNSLLPQG